MTEPLLFRRGRAEAKDSKTVQTFAFDVPAGVEALTLRFDYGPRTSTDRAQNAPLIEAAFDKYVARRRATGSAEEVARHRKALNIDGRAELLHNLMNVVLIDPSGRWRGRWDRNPSSDAGALVLARTHASRGFVPGAIDVGRWSVAIECHGVFGDPVSFEVEVDRRAPLTESEVAKLAQRIEPEGGPTPLAPDAPPRRSGPGWYFGELHSHTVHSDGKWELLELTTRARNVGADFLCLTDHNTTSGLRDPGDLPVTLIPGIELTTFHGHHPIYGLTTILPWHEEGRVLGIEETGPRARRGGAIVSVAHPFVPGDPLCTGCRAIDDLDPSVIDLMEVWYRRWDSPGSDNEAAYALWNRFWSEGHPVTAVGARDWHGPEQDGPFPGPMPFTAVFAEENTTEAILDGMRAGHVIMSGGPILELEMRDASGNRALIGGVVTSATTPSLSARVSRSRSEAGLELRVHRSGELVHTAIVSADGPISLDGCVDRPGYYRAELWAGKEPRAITNHVVWRR